MEDSPSSEANSHSGSPEIPHLLWNPKVRYHVQKGQPLVPILSQMNPDHNFPPYFPNIYSNIVLPSTPRSSECLFSSGFLNKILHAFISPMHVITCPAHQVLLDLIILVISAIFTCNNILYLLHCIIMHLNLEEYTK